MQNAGHLKEKYWNMVNIDENTRRKTPNGVPAVLAILSQRFGGRFSASQAMRDQHGSSLTWLPAQAPDGVVFPETTEEVAAIVRLCGEHHVPVIPYGTGTSLEGHVNAPFGGISIDMSRMNAVLAVHAEDLDVVVQPGVTRKQLNEFLRDQGLFFPIDPGADASLGGMAATRASGTNAVRYGTMKDNVLSLKVVLADGEVITTASRARKSSAGYDLTRLMVGSEGTLGVITELTLRLHGIPEAISAGICPFVSERAACDTVIATIQSGLAVARIELLDALMVQAANAYSKLDLPLTPMLFVEFHGSDAGVAEQAERFGAIAAEYDGGPFSWATKSEDRSKLWTARHNAYWAAASLRPGARSVATDVCVPLSRLAECVAETRRDIDALGLIAPIVGHVGDGNFHVQPLIDMSNDEEVAACKGFLERLVHRALAMEGTCTGEHGVGQGKGKYLAQEHGEATMVTMRAIKQALDPQGIMNPGKIFTS